MRGQRVYRADLGAVGAVSPAGTRRGGGAGRRCSPTHGAGAGPDGGAGSGIRAAPIPVYVCVTLNTDPRRQGGERGNLRAPTAAGSRAGSPAAEPPTGR